MEKEWEIPAGLRCGKTVMRKAKDYGRKGCAQRGDACRGCRSSYFAHGSLRCSLEYHENLKYVDLLKMRKEEQ